MAKADVPPLPDRVPAKRRQLQHGTLDVHIAMWLTGDTITPSERRRLEEEKARRRALVPDMPVGLLVGREGVTKAQVAAIVAALAAAQPTEIHHPGVAGPLHSACRRLDVPVTAVRNMRSHHLALPPFAAHASDHDAMREVVHNCKLVIAAPKEMAEVTAKSPVWDMIRLAKHRSVAVQIVLPDGRNIGSANGP